MAIQPFDGSSSKVSVCHCMHLFSRHTRDSIEGSTFSLSVEAVKCYSQAIAAAEHDETLYANRSAAYLALYQYQAALQDAAKAVQLHQSWPKGYYRSVTQAHLYIAAVWVQQQARSMHALPLQFVNVVSRLGRAHMAMGDWDTAAAALSQGLHLDPSNDQMVRHWLATL